MHICVTWPQWENTPDVSLMTKWFNYLSMMVPYIAGSETWRGYKVTEDHRRMMPVNWCTRVHFPHFPRMRETYLGVTDYDSRVHFVNVPIQWQTPLHCNVVSHWLGAYTTPPPLLDHIGWSPSRNNGVRCMSLYILIGVLWSGCTVAYLDLRLTQ